MGKYLTCQISIFILDCFERSAALFACIMGTIYRYGIIPAGEK